jgi:hypothetical protein
LRFLVAACMARPVRPAAVGSPLMAAVTARLLIAAWIANRVSRTAIAPLTTAPACRGFRRHAWLRGQAR